MGVVVPHCPLCSFWCSSTHPVSVLTWCCILIMCCTWLDVVSSWHGPACYMPYDSTVAYGEAAMNNNTDWTNIEPSLVPRLLGGGAFDMVSSLCRLSLLPAIMPTFLQTFNLLLPMYMPTRCWHTHQWRRHNTDVHTDPWKVGVIIKHMCEQSVPGSFLPSPKSPGMRLILNQAVLTAFIWTVME